LNAIGAARNRVSTGRAIEALVEVRTGGHGEQRQAAGLRLEGHVPELRQQDAGKRE
jgi:hypothetical protein